MQKKTLFTLKITDSTLPIVSKGKKVVVGDKLTKIKPSDIEKLDLVKMLGILPKNLHHYLKIKENSLVKKGDIIAQKKTFLKKTTIEAPVDGKFVILDKEKGIVGIEIPQIGQEIVAWFNGEITDINKDQIVINISGVVVAGNAGKGKPISGKLKVYSQNLDTFELPVDIEEKILAIKSAASDLIAKADALGALAIIAEKVDEPPFALPYLIVDNIENLKNFSEKSVVVYGDEKHLLII